MFIDILFQIILYPEMNHDDIYLTIYLLLFVWTLQVNI